jgi:hypothetical protein
LLVCFEDWDFGREEIAGWGEPFVGYGDDITSKRGGNEVLLAFSIS